jgi:hypothetical protein
VCLPVSLVRDILKCLDVLLVVFTVETLHLPCIALVHPSFQCRVVLSLEPLQQRGFELTNTTTTGSGVEAVRLLESIEAA